MHLDADDIAMLWKCYSRSRTVRLRNMLVEHYLWLVDVAAKKLVQRLADVVEFDDLRSAGIFGLVRAVERFELSRGVQFNSFAALHIHGSMLDELRTCDWLPRGARQRVKRWGEAADLLLVTNGVRPTEDEVAESLHVSAATDRHARRAGAARTFSLTTLTENDEELGGEWESDNGCGDPSRSLAATDEVEHLLSRLMKRHRQLIQLRYIEGRGFHDIGRVIGRSHVTACSNTQYAMSRLIKAAA